MANFLDPQLAASKASRKERRQAAKPSESNATARAVASLQRAMGKDFRKADSQERLIAKAIADTMPELIAAMDEDALAPLFFALERVATAPNRRRIAKHPLRPEIVDELHLEADEEEDRAAEKAAEAEADNSDGKAAEKPERLAGATAATPEVEANASSPEQ